MKVTTRHVCSLVLVAAIGLTASAAPVSFGTGGNQFAIDFVPIGNPGNPADNTGKPVPPYPTGSVPYVYNMAKYEIGRDMVTKASAAGGLGITLDSMDFVNGTLGVGPRDHMPATGVSWNEAARFVNWLNTSQGYSPAYKFATQPGDVGYSANAIISLWVSGDAGFNASNRFRNSLAHYFLPSVDEWYKAAYYDPTARGGTGGYWNYPTGSDSAPTAVGSGTGTGTAVSDQTLSNGPADITLAGGLSPYGTMAQGGNAFEWEETDHDLVNDEITYLHQAFRGGSWDSRSIVMSAVSRSLVDSTRESNFLGFRVASIPEPGTAYLGALSMIGLLQWSRRIS